jgi:hypothetical protein
LSAGNEKNGSGNAFLDAAMLAFESQEVIGLRLMKLAQGGTAANTEVRQMVEEKICAMTKATSMMTAASMQGRPDQGAEDVVKMLRQKVRANRVRLTK